MKKFLIFLPLLLGITFACAQQPTSVRIMRDSTGKMQVYMDGKIVEMNDSIASVMMSKVKGVKAVKKDSVQDIPLSGTISSRTSDVKAKRKPPVLKLEVDSMGNVILDPVVLKRSKESYNLDYESFLSEYLAGKPCPSFALTEPDGKVWENTDLAGKVTVINTWHIYCGPCKKEMPVLNELMGQYPDVRFLAVTFNTPKEIEKIVRETPFLFTQLTGAKKFLDDNQLTVFPVNLLLDKQGVIRYVVCGGESSSHGRLKEALGILAAE